MTSHYDLEQAKTARDEGMKQAESKIDPKWRQHVLEAIRRCAAEKKELLVDDVWRYLEDAIGKEEAETENNRKMGPLMTEARKNQWIKRTNPARYEASARKSSHANPRVVWESLIYQPNPLLYGYQPELPFIGCMHIVDCQCGECYEKKR
jgi:hypothetical protein|tara:strand:- start:306 stop:755 length:450 start_codon:yes stop_codon:yes gene_type:complete